jgi:hypothetical protein
MRAIAVLNIFGMDAHADQGGMMGSGNMMGGRMGRGMKGCAMMRGDATAIPIMLRMVFALMDADGDGTISLPEFQVAHERISRRWIATEMAISLWKRCSRSCTGPGARFRNSRKLRQTTTPNSVDRWLDKPPASSWWIIVVVIKSTLAACLKNRDDHLRGQTTSSRTGFS